MPVETSVTQSSEALLSGERLYESFYEGLRLVAAEERRFAGMILGIEPDKMTDLGANFSIEQLQEFTDNLRDLYYGKDDKPKLHNAIINKSLEAHIQREPQRYEAFTKYPPLLALAKRLSRMGVLNEFSRQRVTKARAERFMRQQGSQNVHRTAVNGLRKAAEADDLIAFNHAVRDLITSKAGEILGIDRTKARRIIKTVMMSDGEASQEIEQGIALEVAAKRLMDRMMTHTYGEGSLAFGSKQQDKRGGDIILFPGSADEVFVDIKQTPPEDVRREINPEAIEEPNFFWKGSQKVFLWLGSGNSVGENYSLPAEFTSTVGQMVKQAEPQLTVA